MSAFIRTSARSGWKNKVFPAFIIEGEEEQSCPNSGIR